MRLKDFECMFELLDLRAHSFIPRQNMFWLKHFNLGLKVFRYFGLGLESSLNQVKSSSFVQTFHLQYWAMRLLFQLLIDFWVFQSKFQLPLSQLEHLPSYDLKSSKLFELGEWRRRGYVKKEGNDKNVSILQFK